METSQQGTPLQSPQVPADDWEEWEDDDVVTPIQAVEQVHIELPPSPKPLPRHNKRSSRSQPLIKRFKSLHRQKLKNAKAGITVITDMSVFSSSHNRTTKQLPNPVEIPRKFVDVAALRALEGEPTSASVGNWNWLKKGKSPVSSRPSAAAQSSRSAISPEDRPIMIGFTLPDGTSNSTSTSQPVFGVASPSIDNHESTYHSASTDQFVSVWSPDTPNSGTATNSMFRPPSSVYSRAPDVSQPPSAHAPPVPSLPVGYQKHHNQRLISLDMGGNDFGDNETISPYTLFEEDGAGSPHGLTLRVKESTPTLTPKSAGSRSRGWWDHITTPFTDNRFTLINNSRASKLPINHSGTGKLSPNHNTYMQEINRSVDSVPIRSGGASPNFLVPAPQRTQNQTTNSRKRDEEELWRDSSSTSCTSCSCSSESTAGKQRPKIIITSHVPCEEPPPYSPPKAQQNTAAIRYRAIFPPGHPLQAQFPPSPGPASPALISTMTSQGHTPLTDIPITPTIPREMPLPIRPAGTYLPQEYSHNARGREHRVERQRRRHEKEEIVARKLGGLWRGRGCVPERGCFGRTGAEGRKKRRIFLGVLIAVLSLVILGVVLGVVLNSPKSPEQIQSIWVNLTDYPPMPTGVLTFVGPDNTIANSGCTEPSTLWSCSLPKEQHDSVAPYNANQPTVIFQIQWDNSTKRAWDVPNGNPPTSVGRRALGGAALAGNSIRRRQDNNFIPEPKPPAFEEMWFLGNTTDGIVSTEKAGEATPFFISVLGSIDDRIVDPVLSKRQTTIGDETLIKDVVPPPDLLEDGTPAPAMMLPKVRQQPVRLYDRGLPTEHYGFYTYFKRTIYLKSITRFNQTEDEAVPLDEDGGCTKSEANFLATWAETRMLVQIWTRKIDSKSSKVFKKGEGAVIGGSGSAELIRPGTMPYPVNVKLDTHGGDRYKKFVWMWPMDERQNLDTKNPKLMANKLDFGGSLINRRKGGDRALGGFDGGTGGCKCEWVNWT